MDGPTTLSVASVNARGVASFSTKSFDAGEHSVHAEYSGDDHFSASESPMVVQVVEKADTELVLKSSRNPAPYGAAVTLTATLKVLPPGSGTPNGSITFLEDGTPVATAPFEGKKVVTYSLKGHAPGTDDFQAIFSGDASYESSASNVLNQVINKAATVVTLKSSSNPTSGGLITLTATVSVILPGTGIPTGSTTFYEDGIPVAKILLPEGKRVAKYSIKGHPPGVFEFVVAYSGDKNYEASESAPLIQLIAPYAPGVAAISPNSGPESGGTVVAIEGQNLAHATEVKFGSAPAQSFEVISPSLIEAVSPAAGNGTVDVTVTTPGGVSSSSPSDEFSYLSPPSVTSISPNSGPESGGAIVKVTGTGFTGATAVTFASDKWGDAEAQSFKVVSSTLIEAVSPAGTGGAFVVVTTPIGVSQRVMADFFSYVPPQPVKAYDNYGPATLGHAMCRGNPARPESMPGGTATQTFTVPSGVASLSSATIEIDPDTTVTAHLTLKINGTIRATTSAAAVGDTKFSWSPVAVKAGDAASLSITFTATFGKIITIYSAAAVGGTLTYSNSCPDGAPSGTTPNGLRAVVSGLSP
jgi:hypothetical protein